MVSADLMPTRTLAPLSQPVGLTIGQPARAQKNWLAMMQAAQARMRSGRQQGETQKLCRFTGAASRLPGIPQTREQQTLLGLITNQKRLPMSCTPLPFVKT